MQARLTLADVRRLVGELPAEQRASLMLVAVDGLSYADAADMLGVPAGTVASRVARARLALVQALEGVDVVAADRRPHHGKEWMMDKVDPATLVAYRRWRVGSAREG